MLSSSKKAKPKLILAWFEFEDAIAANEQVFAKDV
jgi:hypothetical protein